MKVMKKNFLFGIVMMIVAVFGGIRAYNHYTTNSEMSALLMNNVEALTDPESGDSPWLRTCYAYGYWGSSDEYVCEGQRPDDDPKTCVTVAYYKGHADYKRKCVLRGI